jgi:acyl-CoA synthetase (AMP-forming)/AMP-acid ligase II
MSVIDSFIAQCHKDPLNTCFVFLNEKGDIQQQLTRIELHEKALNLASYLVNNLKISPGELVLLVYPQSLDFIIALLACLYAGIIPAPIAPPNPFRDIKYDLDVFRRIAKKYNCTAILTNNMYSNIKKLTSLKHLFTLDSTAWSELPWYSTTQVDSNKKVDLHTKSHDLSTIAYCQFTSGSTTDPKGVMITYGNLAHQLQGLTNNLGFGENAKAVIWMPQYHSSCLVGVIFNILQNGGTTYFFSPLDFLKKPYLWFDIITRYRGTHTTAPEFALKKMLEYQQKNSITQFNLSSLMMLCMGGEVNNYETMSAFINVFKEAGFNPKAYTPGYGMTEHTLGITMNNYWELPPTLCINKNKLLTENELVPTNKDEYNKDTYINFISNGRPLDGVEVKIIHPESQEKCADGKIGEITVKSPSMANQYNEKTGYLHTGDLGALLDGHLYVIGRLKDMVIVNGRNIYLSDIDYLLRDAHPTILNNGIATLSYHDKLIILVETDKKDKQIKAEATDIFTNIRGILTKSLSITYQAVVVCKSETLLRTNTGKIRRQPTCEALMQGKLDSNIIITSGNINIEDGLLSVP